MVRKASTLCSLDELELSPKTRVCLENQRITYAEMVRRGREIAFNAIAKPRVPSRQYKWKKEIIDALDKAGFIRHDFFPRTYCAIDLLCAVYEEDEHPLFDNDNYENFKVISDQQFESILHALDATLSEKEAGIIKYWFGLEGNSRLKTAQIGKIFSCSEERARHIVNEAIKKLREYNEFPSIYGFGDVPSPYNNPYTIETVGFSMRCYNYLKRAHVNTVYDIVRRPKRFWTEVGLFNKSDLMEIERKVRSFDEFKSFSILS